MAVILLVGLATTACQTSSAGPAHGPDIVIASDLPTSGYGADAIPAQQAIAFAIRQAGSIDGFKLGYQPFDDSLSANSNPLRGLNNVRRMIDDQRVLGMIGPLSSRVTYAEFAVANAADLVMLSPFNTNSCVTLALSFCDPGLPPRLNASHPNNYFRIAAPDPIQGRAMARFATVTLKVQRVAAFDMWPGDGDLIIQNFADEMARGGGRLLFSRDLPVATTDFSEFLKAASAAGAQAVYAVTDGESQTVCAARAQMTPVLFPQRSYFLATDGINTDDQCIQQTAGNSSDLYYTFSDVDPRHSEDKRVLDEIAAYLKEYPKPSDVSIYTFAAYDCARILIDAIGRAIQKNQGGFPSRAQVSAALADSHDFEGVTGTYTFDANGDAISPLMSIYRVESGHWVYATKIEAAASGS